MAAAKATWIMTIQLVKPGVMVAPGIVDSPCIMSEVIKPVAIAARTIMGSLARM